MKIIFEFDDLNPDPLVDCLFIIEEFVKKYPNIILNFFTIPIYQETSLSSNLVWLSKVQNLINSGNVVLGVHGYKHTQEEFRYKTYEGALDSLKKAEKEFNKANLPFVKAFKGPHWGINSETCEALITLGYTHLYNHHSYPIIDCEYGDKLKMCYYSWNLKDDWGTFESEPEDIIIAHGHTSKHSALSCGNSIWSNFYKIMQIMEQPNIQCLRLDEK